MHVKEFHRALRVIALCGFVAGLEAQIPATSDPGAVHQENSETEQYLRLQRQIDKKPQLAGPVVRDETGAKSKAAPQTATIFLLAHVDVPSSAILSAAEVKSITARYEGRLVAFADLDAIVAQINALYARKGYITARAVLPPQTVVSGVVHIQLIESRLGNVIVENKGRTRESYFTNRLAVRPGDLLEVNAINASLQRFNATNDARVSALLRAGEQFGTTDLVLQVQTPPPISASFSSDDAGLISTGRERIGNTETVENIFGYRDPLRVGGYWSDGMWAGFGSYDFPLTTSGVRFGPEVSYDTIRVRQSALQKLGFSGSFYDLSLRLSRPLRVSPRWTLSGYLAPHFQQSRLESQGYRVSNVPVRSLEIGASLQAPDRHGFWSANVFSAGGDYNVLKLNAFVKFGGSASRFQTFGKNLVVIFRASGQGKAADPAPLPPSQEFQIGGLSTVRGYPEGAFIGDAGYATSAEADVALPVGDRKLFGQKISDRVRVAAFIDHAGLLRKSETYLTGAGGGVILNLSQYLQGRIYLGTPLEHRGDYHPTQIHFAVEAKPPFEKLFGWVHKPESK